MSLPLTTYPVRSVLCQGAPREMGVQQGVAMRTDLVRVRQQLRHLEAFRNRKPWWLPFWTYRWLAERKTQRLLEPALAESYPRQLERLHGLAEGAGVPPARIFLFNAMEPLLSSVSTSTGPPAACSAVAVRGSRSASGQPMMFRNFDYLPLVQPFYFVRRSQPTSGYAALEFTSAPLVGTIDGINERGLCIAYDYAFTTDPPPAPRAPISYVIAEALERCASVAEAAEWIASRPRWGGALLMLVDAAGDIASLELSSRRSFLRRPEASADLLYHSNAFTSPTMREIQIPWNAVYSQRAPTPLRGRRLHQSSEMRDCRFAELLAGNEAYRPERLAAVMADHGAAGVPGDFTICVHGSYWNTTACSQFYPQERRMRIALSTACSAEFVDFQL